jgi:hypothetical protein
MGKPKASSGAQSLAVLRPVVALTIREKLTVLIGDIPIAVTI